MSVRGRFSTQLLSQTYEAKRLDYIAALERAVAVSPVSVAPGPTWVGPNIDTLLIFLDDKLVAGLCVRRVAMLDPLVVVEHPGEVAAGRLLDYGRLRAEGVLQGMGFNEYMFCIPEADNGTFAELMRGMEGTEVLEGLSLFQRRL